MASPISTRSKTAQKTSSKNIHRQKLQKFIREDKGVGQDVMSDEGTVNKMAAATAIELENMKAFIVQRMDENTDKLEAKLERFTAKLEQLEVETVNLKELVTFESARIDDMHVEMNKMKTAIKKTEAKQNESALLQELYSRKINLLLYGIPNEKNAENEARDIFANLGIENASTMLFANCHRLPRLNPEAAVKKGPNPIIVKFVRMSDREAVLRASYRGAGMLREKKITIRTDLPVTMKKFRAKLANRAYDIRQKMKHQTRIVERGLVLSLQSRPHKDANWKDVDTSDLVNDGKYPE